MVLLGALALSSPLFVGRGALPPLAAAGPPVARSAGRGFWVAALALTVLAACLWSQRLGASLWTDESTSMRLYMVGRWKHNGEGSGRLFEPSWARTLHGYETPNNHVLYSAAARIAHGAFAGINDTDFDRPFFNEAVLRLPAYIAALVSVSLVGYLAMRLCSLLAAWLAMSWAVLHPWYLEFATSARGYSFAMCGLALSAVALVKIFLGGGGWRWWALHALGQLVAFLAMPTVAHTLVFLNIAAFVALLMRPTGEARARLAHLRAFFGVNLFALAFAWVGYGSKISAMREYMASGLYHTQIGGGWVRDCLSRIFVGEPYASWAEGHPLAHATGQWPAPLFALGCLAAVAFSVAAVWGWCRRGVFTGLLALAVLAPPVTTYIQGRMSEFYLFSWYVVWQLPLLLAFLGTGAAALIAKLPGGGRGRALAGLALVVLIGAATSRQLRAYLGHPVEGQRESAAAMRPSPNPFAPDHGDILTATLVTANHAYDPWNMRLKGEEGLWELVREAERSGKPLFIDTAWIAAVRRQFPRCAPVVLDSGAFELELKVFGLQPQNTRYVYRYRPGALAGALAGRDGGGDR